MLGSVQTDIELLDASTSTIFDGVVLPPDFLSVLFGKALKACEGGKEGRLEVYNFTEQDLFVNSAKKKPEARVEANSIYFLS